MNGTIRLSLWLAIFALSISFANSQGGGSYLNALQRSASDPGIHKAVQPQPISPPPFRRNSYERTSGRSYHGGQNGRHGSCRSDYKFDYIMLTLQWGPGFCATSPQACRRSENRLFTVHGMWPQFYNSDSPAFCCFDNTFDYNQIQALLPQLNKYWFSYYSDNSRSFWSHEWLKHGTCLRDVKPLQGEEAFFGTTLNIVKKLPVLETLTKAGIVPGDNKSYSSTEIQNALRQLTGGKRAKIECDLEAHQPTPLLKGVDFCFDHDLQFIDCPPSKSRCQRQLLFLNR